MNDEYVKTWWRKQVAEGYFKEFSFGFSYHNMDRFDLKVKVILEIGFGYGREISQFCKISKNVYGVDIAPAAIDLTYKNLKELKIENMPKLKSYNGLIVPFNQQFDFIYSCFVIQHMSKENAKKLIRNCITKLSSSGRIFFEFYGHPDFLGKEKDAISENPTAGGMYNNAYTKEEIYNLIKDLNCGIDWIEEWAVSDINSKGETIKFNNYWVCIKKKND